MTDILRKLIRAYQSAVINIAADQGHEVRTFAEALQKINRDDFEEARRAFTKQIEAYNAQQ